MFSYHNTNSSPVGLKKQHNTTQLEVCPTKSQLLADMHALLGCKLLFLFLSSDLSLAFFCWSGTYHHLHHDDKDPVKDGGDVGEEGERVSDVVHVATVRLLDDLLHVVHHVSHKDQEAGIDLQGTQVFVSRPFSQDG